MEGDDNEYDCADFDDDDIDHDDSDYDDREKMEPGITYPENSLSAQCVFCFPPQLEEMGDRIHWHYT